MSTLTSSLIVRLIDQVTGPARGVEESLQRINRAGGAGSGAAPSFADNMAVAQARVGAAIEQNNRAMDSARGRMVDAVAGYYLLDRTIGRTVRVAAGFEEAMNGVAVVSRASEEELTALRTQAAELGRTTMFTASEVADGMGFLAMAGFNAEQVMASMENTLNLAAAGNLDLARSADIVSNILTGYAMEVSDLTRVSDILTGTFTRTNTNLEQLGTAFTYAGPIAAAAGMDFAETAAILGRLGDAGYQGSLGGTALRGAIVRLLAPTSGAATMMENLGVSIDDVVGDGEDLDESLADAARAMEQIGLQVTDAEGRMLPFVDIMRQLEGHADDVGLMAGLFGQRAGPAMAALLSQGSDGVRELTAELDALSGEAQRVAEVRMRGFNGQMRAFRSAVEGVQIAIGGALLPTLTDLISRFTEVMGPVTAFLEANPRLTKAIVGTVAAMIGLKVAVAGLTFIGLLGKGGALSLLYGGLRALTLLGTPVAGFFETLRMRSMLATRAMGQSPGILARIGDAARVLVRSIPGVGLVGKALSGIGLALAGLSAPVWGAVVAGAAAVVAVGALVWKHWDRISAIFRGVASRVWEELQPAFEALRPVMDALQPIFDGVSSAASAVAAGFGQAGQAIRDFIGWVSSFFEREALTDDEAAAWEEWGADAAGRMIDAIKAVFGYFPRFISGQWAGDVFEALTGIDLTEAGERAVESLKQAFDGFLEWIRGLPARIISAIGSIDLGGLIRWPEPPAWWRRLTGGEEAAPAPAPASVGAAPAPAPRSDDVEYALEAAREIARLRQAIATESAMPTGQMRQLQVELADVEEFLGEVTSGMPEAAMRDISAFVDALESGGAEAEAEATRLAQQITESLSVTATPVVDVSSILAAHSAVQQLNLALDTAAAPRTASSGSGGRAASRHRATGGPVWPGSSFLVGERQPELFTPSTGGRITPLSQLEAGIERLMSSAFASMASGGGAGGSSQPVQVTIGDIIVNGASDPVATAQQVRDVLSREIDMALRGLNADMGVRS